MTNLTFSPATTTPSVAPLLAPPPIARGQTLAIAAPAGPVASDRLKRGLAHLGDFRLAMRDDIDRKDGYFAGSDAQRLEEFNGYLQNPDVRAIMMARGGYGIMRLLPHLDAAALRADPKPIIGFSDGTALHAWVMSCGLQALHGPVVTQLGELDPASVHRLLALMTGEPAGPVEVASATADASGVLVGGNLSVLCHLMGTPWQIPTQGRLLFLEDVGEEPYRVDRMLTQLAIAGQLKAASAILGGDFTRCGPRDHMGDSTAAIELVKTNAAAANVPVATGIAAGHGARNEAFYMGAKAQLDANKRQLVFVTG